MSDPLSAAVVPVRRLALGYVLMLGVAVAVFLAIRSYGESLHGPEAAATPGFASPAAPPTAHVLPHILLALATIIALGRLLGAVCGRLGQPPVIGEVIAGILLGPSLLGRIAPAAMEFLFPAGIAPHLSVLAQLGVILFMFLVGLQLNAELLRARVQATVAISHAGIVAPFLVGAALALALYQPYAPAGVSFTSFALFMGVALAITAFPVLARILTDRGLAQTELGVIALGCAAADDITAWCLLAVAVGVAQAQAGGALTTAALAMCYLVVMFAIVRPVVARWLPRAEGEPVRPALVAWVLVGLLLSALTTEAIGVHALFGAFLLGAIIPHDSALARALHAKLSDVVSVLLLPAFFAYTGLRTEIGLLEDAADWLMCAVIIVAATLGKFGGAFVAARLTGLNSAAAAALGILMNTRGLMELIVLNLGLELGIISPTLFAMMVLMALVTTIAAAPLLGLLGERVAVQKS
jgi:Kef-type K+ transport system membrane component KefB